MYRCRRIADRRYSIVEFAAICRGPTGPPATVAVLDQAALEAVLFPLLATRHATNSIVVAHRKQGEYSRYVI